MSDTKDNRHAIRRRHIGQCNKQQNMKIGESEKMDKYITVQVEYVLNEREQKALTELLPYFREYTNKNMEKPFKDWGIENLFRSIMTMGSGTLISSRIKEMQLRQGKIDIEEFLNNEPFQLDEERR